jgi:hypothetical protein
MRDEGRGTRDDVLWSIDEIVYSVNLFGKPCSLMVMS